MFLTLPNFFGSSRSVRLRSLEGRDESLFLEGWRSPIRLVTDLLGQVVVDLDGTEPSRERLTALTLGERDILLARLRQQELGDKIESIATCPQCGKRLDMDFSLTAFLSHFQPKMPRGVEPDEEGWFRLREPNHTFRPPTSADLEALEMETDLKPSQRRRWLAQRCIEPLPERGRSISRIERAMAKLSPQLTQELEAKCAECGAGFSVAFDLAGYVLREFEQLSRTLIQDIHLLARWYHWRLEEILSLPRQRRIQFVNALGTDLRGQTG